MLQKINAYWRAANYLSVGQLYLQNNPLLKDMLLGHWGTTPYTHLDRIIKQYDLNMLYVSGHGGPGVVAGTI